MKTIQQWFDEYGESHQNKTNKTIHWICVPSIFFSIVGLLFEVKLPFLVDIMPEGYAAYGNMALVVVLLGLLFYLRLSWQMAIGVGLFSAFCLYLAHFLELNAGMPLWQICLIIFVVAWIGQFYGHKVEGAKPSFFKDVQYLMIGPAWLLGFIYKKLGLNY